MSSSNVKLSFAEKFSYGLGDCSANMVIVYTANNLPFNALLSRMTLDVQDRASAAALRFVMTPITAIITNAVTAKLLASVGWRKLSIIYAIIAMVLSALCFFGVKEHVGENGRLHAVGSPANSTSRKSPSRKHSPRWSRINISTFRPCCLCSCIRLLLPAPDSVLLREYHS